jgi:hypothetical protein
MNGIPTPSLHIELFLYATDTAILSMSRNPTLLVSYLESYLSNQQWWLTEWRIAINISKNTAIIFAGRRYINSRSFTSFMDPIEWVSTTLYPGVSQDKRLILSPHIDQAKKQTSQRMGMLGPLLNR